jgi:hypothetical protein
MVDKYSFMFICLKLHFTMLGMCTTRQVTVVMVVPMALERRCARPSCQSQQQDTIGLVALRELNTGKAVSCFKSINFQDLLKLNQV